MHELQLQETPDYVRSSLAAAMIMGFRNGRFFRNARLQCVNLLMTYKDGCRANCSYCGLSRRRVYEKHQSFIRVEWPAYLLDNIISAISERNAKIRRICISMITHPEACSDTEIMVKRIRERLDTQISLLLSPTVLSREHLITYRNLGVDRVGIAIDAATPALFEKHRGESCNGPHQWEHYWHIFEESVDVFGQGNAGAHFIVGLGESEREMCAAIEHAHTLGGVTHLFSFYPESGSRMQNTPPPPIGTYRRIQIFRYLCDTNRITLADLGFDEEGHIRSLGLDETTMDSVIASGEPFKTSGCPDNETGVVACTRPFGNSPPGDEVRNLPYEPDVHDIERIRHELWTYSY